MSKFTLTIEVGNDATLTGDVADALGKVARLLHLSGVWEYHKYMNTGECGGLIKDANGNTVGDWELKDARDVIDGMSVEDYLDWSEEDGFDGAPFNASSIEADPMSAQRRGL